MSQLMEDTSRKPRPSRACEICHEKKRKRRRLDSTATATSPKRDSWLQGRDVLDEQHNSLSQPTTPLSPRRQDVRIPAGPNHCIGNQPVPPVETPTADPVDNETPDSRGYLGRLEYLGVAASQAKGTTEAPASENILSAEEKAILKIHRAFNLPPPAIQQTLIDTFKTYCAPWTPIVENSWLREPRSNPPSLLLLQSVFVAGSRFAAAPHISASSETYYRRAKALFFSSYEKNPIIRTAAACLLNWFNPSAPEEVSLDSSNFWLRVAVSIAYQIGLHREPPRGKFASYRRRLWWTLVARDCQISAAHGRPRAISLEDSDVAPLSARDFPAHHDNAEFFMAHVNISLIMGDVTQTYLRHQLSPLKRREIRNALYCWVTELPDKLCLFSQGPARRLNPYDMCTRSLYVPYFVTVLILYRSVTPHETSTTIGAVASSFICGIFEEFLARDECRFLAAGFKFYAFAAGVAQLNARPYVSLQSDIRHQVETVKHALTAHSERWPSAKNNIRILENIGKTMPTQMQQTDYLPVLSGHHEASPLFRAFGPELCHMWYLVDQKSAAARNESMRKVPWQTDDCSDTSVQPGSKEPQAGLPMVPPQPPLAPGDFADPLTSLPMLDTQSPDLTMDPGIWTWPVLSGNWLLDGLPGGYPAGEGWE
ncbi:hypothetical protein N7510_011157 [Penicillium lagena]|uniref:uncharacterized protein n=1 Tax=Penicillium lagena TaxID=94218 RepID=UPI0025416C7A|nr:uncharacterized protein N7510_011157 [Penicillium lagena]KAJ5601623.1 hypothetical protein N7510_011157 [Penicillium lagena]